jgi:hypothetical protein
MIVDSLIQSSLEIAIPHIDEMIASEDATRNDFTLYEDAEYLASYFFIRGHFRGPYDNQQFYRVNGVGSCLACSSGLATPLASVRGSDA